MTSVLEPPATTDPQPARLSGISFVLPCFNEAGNVEATLAAVADAGGLVADRFEAIVVDDGSTDGTGRIAARIAAADPRVRLVVHPVNRGYGAALRSGIAAAREPWILLMDADGQFDPRQLEDFLPFVGSADLLVGYRILRRDPLRRRVNGALWNRLVRLALGLPVRDVDCAFKLLPRVLVQGITLECEGAGISAELLARCLRGGATVREVGVHHLPRVAGEQSGARLPVILRGLRELANVRRHVGSTAHGGPR